MMNVVTAHHHPSEWAFVVNNIPDQQPHADKGQQK